MSSNFLKNQLQSWFQPTDNRLAMKLFGSKKALVKERIRQKTAGHWVIINFYFYFVLVFGWLNRSFIEYHLRDKRLVVKVYLVSYFMKSGMYVHLVNSSVIYMLSAITYSINYEPTTLGLVRYKLVFSFFAYCNRIGLHNNPCYQ